MSTGLHSKIEIHIGGQLIETKEYDDTIENLIIGSGSDANICIDVEGVEQMHAVVTIGDGMPPSSMFLDLMDENLPIGKMALQFCQVWP